MKIEIKTIGGSVLFEGDFSSLSDAVKAAVKSRANLSRADLSRADLSRANLYGADLYGQKIVKSERPFFEIGPLGSRSDNLLAFLTKNGIRIKAGCFFGTVEEFQAKVKETHGNNTYSKEYEAAMVLIVAHFDLWKGGVK